MDDVPSELRFPIGEFIPPDRITDEQVAAWIDRIEALPAQLRRLVEPLTKKQLETRYREGGWTVAQVVHHLADSHMNSFVRFKWALTEEEPTIKAYHEDRWAELGDYQRVPIPLELQFIECLHAKWVALLRSLRNEDLLRAFVHPDSGRVPLATNVGIYAWHGEHHLAHITGLARRSGWQIDLEGVPG